MADIQQAAKWMMSGKMVRRLIWEESKFWEIPRRSKSGRVVNFYSQTPYFFAQDLLADDWELVEDNNA